MSQPRKASSDLQEHWASAPSPGSDIWAEDDRAPRSTRLRNLGWAGFVLILILGGVLTAGYTLGLLGDWQGLPASLTETVPPSAGGGHMNVTGEAAAIDNSARQVEAPSFPERERADSTARAAVAVPGQVQAGAPGEASARTQVEGLLRLLEQSETTWAEGYNAERQRAEGIARDLATVRAELADHATAEAAARAEVARMAKLLEAKEAEWANKLDAERKRSEGAAKDLASVRAELADRTPAKASASTEVAQQAKLFEAKEAEWTKKLDAERKRSDGAAKDLASVRAELADHVTAEASARAEVARTAKLFEAKEAEWAKKLDAERKRSDGVVKELAGVRAELADQLTAKTSAGTEVAKQAKLLEAQETEWAKKLEAERKRSEAVAQDLAGVRAELADRATAEASVRAEAAQSAKLLEAKESEWTKKLDAERKRSDAVAKDLATVRAELATRATAETSARTEAAQTAKLLAAKDAEWTKKLETERERSAGVAKDLASVRAEFANRATAGASARTANGPTPSVNTGSAVADRQKTASAPEPLRVTTDRGGGSISTTVASAAEEARLIVRAEALIGQGDVAAARRFLERAVEGQSARAAFLLAETYDARILRTLQVYGVRGDTHRALELYKMALDGGIDKAKERMSALRAESP
jgi:hypothetical protein